MPTLLLSADSTVLSLARPTITRALHASAVEQLWIPDICSFVLPGVLVPMGSVGDRTGHRRLMLVGAGAFGPMSVGAGFASPVLILTRAALGANGFALAAVGLDASARSSRAVGPRSSPRP